MKKRIIIIAAIVLILCLAAGCWYGIWNYTYTANVFDATYGVKYPNPKPTGYDSNHPNYFLSQSGILYESELVDGEYQQFVRIGSLHRFTLTEENFDDCFENASCWDGMNCTPEIVRWEHLAAWRVTHFDGTDHQIYYILLMKNGEIYLYKGVKNNGTDLSEWIVLYKLGDSSVYYDFIA